MMCYVTWLTGTMLWLFSHVAGTQGKKGAKRAQKRTTCLLSETQEVLHVQMSEIVGAALSRLASNLA